MKFAGEAQAVLHRIRPVSSFGIVSVAVTFRVSREKKAHPGKDALWEVPLGVFDLSGFFASETLVRSVSQKRWNEFFAYVLVCFLN